MANDLFNSFMTGPDEQGRFGDFGGRFVSETLMPLILELEEQYEKVRPTTVSGPRCMICGPTTSVAPAHFITPNG